MEELVKGMAVIAILPAIAWLILTIHTLHYSELKHGKFCGWFNFWPFYEVMKTNYPAASRAGRGLFIATNILVLPWIIAKFIGQI